MAWLTSERSVPENGIATNVKSGHFRCTTGIQLHAITKLIKDHVVTENLQTGSRIVLSVVAMTVTSIWAADGKVGNTLPAAVINDAASRSEEHTSELQSLR